MRTGKVLGSPAVAYGGDTPGGWLDRFMSGAGAKGYRVDFIALHWYGGDFSTPNAVAQLKSYLQAVYDRYHKPIWLTEFALTDFSGGAARYPTEPAAGAFVTAATGCWTVCHGSSATPGSGCRPRTASRQRAVPQRAVETAAGKASRRRSEVAGCFGPSSPSRPHSAAFVPTAVWPEPPAVEASCADGLGGGGTSRTSQAKPNMIADSRAAPASTPCKPLVTASWTAARTGAGHVPEEGRGEFTTGGQPAPGPLAEPFDEHAFHPFT